jgi:glycosyltransferase involved in cell wall biosynthesis
VRAHRICFLIPDFADGGAQKQCIYLLNELQRDAELDLTLIHLRGGVHEDLLRRERLRLIQLPITSSYDPRNVLRLRAVLRDVRPQILLTWLHSCDVFGYFISRSMPGMRWIMTERDSSYPADPRFVVRRLLGRFADGVVANSDKGLEYWRRAGARGPLFVTSNIVKIQAGCTDIVASRPRRVAMIGRLEPQKNASTTIAAFCRLAAERPDVEFAVIGDGNELAALRQRAADAGAADRIAFMGFRKDVADQIAASGVIVSMSHHEGLPNVMLESVAADRLVVASDIPEHRALLGDDYPFYVVERQDVAAVASAIAAALDARDDTSPLFAAKRRVAAMTPTTVGEAYRNIFDQVMEGQR